MTWAISSGTIPIEEVIIIRRLLNGDTPYQRQKIWDQQLKNNLIISILNGGALPQFIFHLRDKRIPTEYDIIDGKQRLDAILSFYDGGFALPKQETFKLSDKGMVVSTTLSDGISVAGMRFSDLPHEVQRRFMRYELLKTNVATDDHERIRLQFMSLQLGKSLSGGEILTAMGGTVYDVAKEVAEHPAFDALGIEPTAKRSTRVMLAGRLVMNVFRLHDEEFKKNPLNGETHVLKRFTLDYMDAPQAIFNDALAEVAATLDLMLTFKQFPQITTRKETAKNASNGVFMAVFHAMRLLHADYYIEAILANYDMDAWLESFIESADSLTGSTTTGGYVEKRAKSIAQSFIDTFNPVPHDVARLVIRAEENSHLG